MAEGWWLLVNCDGIKEEQHRRLIAEVECSAGSQSEAHKVQDVEDVGANLENNYQLVTIELMQGSNL